jgi:DNA-binding MarR family transcriptional regulator
VVDQSVKADDTATMAHHAPEPPPDHVLVLLEGLQRRLAGELEATLPDDARRLGPRRLRILQLIPPAGATQAALAERALVSKQAVAGLVDALEADGLVERRPDPADGRAWIVARTRRGARMHAAVNAAMAEVERGLAAELGAADYDRLRRAMATLASPSQPRFAVPGT